MDCDGPLCAIDECGLGCTMSCDGGRTCELGTCTDGGCHLQRLSTPTRNQGATLIISACPGGSCNIDCKALDTCSIGACAAGGCTITCAAGAQCTCGDSGCSVIPL
jgi:hypothetical protein